MTFLFSKFRVYFTLAAALAAAFGLFLAFPASARASAGASARNTTPTGYSPADQAVLAQSPGQVSLSFPKEVSENESALQVFDRQGRQVDYGNGGVAPDARHTSLVVNLPTLPQGVYLVKWKAALADGNFISGAYYFGVGRVTLPPDPAAPAVLATLAAVPDRLVTPWSLAGMALTATAAAIVLTFRRRVLK